MTEEIRELTEDDFDRAIPHQQRERIMRGELEGGADVIALRRFLGMTQQAFSQAVGISVRTLRNCEASPESWTGRVREFSQSVGGAASVVLSQS